MSRSAPSPGACAPPSPLVDPQGRRLEYLRLSVTDRCNLRCGYCMPEAGVAKVDPAILLTHEEALRLAKLFVTLGVRRIRVTGGEPLVRKGVVGLMTRLGQLPGQPEILLTTNGLRLARHLDALARAGLRRVNLSLDSLDRSTWRRITRRRGFAAARGAVEQVLARGLGLKLNVVVLAGVNDHELGDFVALTRTLPLTVRFIEAMPFSGDCGEPVPAVGGKEILARLAARYELEPEPVRADAVARVFRVPGHVGRIGVIEGHNRSFCGACNRLRLDARGRLRTCLYGPPVVDLRAMMRWKCSDEDLIAALRGAVARRRPDGHAAAVDATGGASMAGIGG